MSTIVIADDDTRLLKVLGKALGTLADTVALTEDGRLALDRLQELDDVVLVVSDWMMPNMDGPELLKRCKADDRTRDIPFILLTARDSDDDVIKGFEHGADDYVKKPYILGELLARCRNLIKVKLMHDDFKQRAMTDGLTGLANHRAFKERLKNEVSRSSRYGTALTLVMLDVDHFKKFNDTYGHPAGDAVLESLGEILAGTLRGADVASRYGGEEFSLLLPSTPADGGKIMAERLCKSIASHEFRHEGNTLSVTASLGVATLQEGESDEQFLKRADQLLYDAKNRGRNRVSSDLSS